MADPTANRPYVHREWEDGGIVYRRTFEAVAESRKARRARAAEERRKRKREAKAKTRARKAADVFFSTDHPATEPVKLTTGFEPLGELFKDMWDPQPFPERRLFHSPRCAAAGDLDRHCNCNPVFG